MTDEYILAMADQEKAQSKYVFDAMFEAWGQEFCFDELMGASNFAHEQLQENKNPRTMLFYTAVITGAAHLIHRKLEAKQKGKRND